MIQVLSLHVVFWVQRLWLPRLCLSQDVSYDLFDQVALAQYLIDADVRLVPWKSFGHGWGNRSKQDMIGIFSAGNKKTSTF